MTAANIGLKEIRKMAINKISLPSEAGAWIDLWLRDILERGACKGDMYEMMREAYLLGIHHSLLGFEHLKKQGKTPYDDTDKNTAEPA